MLYMLTEVMRLGPKGQVVIPKSFRRILKIGPGSRVVFRLEGERVVLDVKAEDPLRILEAIAKKGKSVSRINPHSYEEELSARNP